MGRGKVKLQRIDDGARRRSSFSKRRNGLLKKARELAVLCDVEVAVVVFTPKGKLFSFSSHSCLERTFEHYTRFADAERKAKDNVPGQNGERVEFAIPEKNHGQSVQQRFLDNRFNELDMTDLNNLEDKLESELKKIRSRKRALLKNAGVDLPQPVQVMDVERESSDKEGEPRSSHRVDECRDYGSSSHGDTMSTPGPSQTLRL